MTLKDLVDELVKEQAASVMAITKDALRDTEETRKLISDWGMAKLEMLIYERLRNHCAREVSRLGEQIQKRKKYGPRSGRLL